MLMGAPKSLTAFAERLKAAGAEILGPTSIYEQLRFRTSKGVGVIYKGKRGETWNPEAIAARDHLATGKGSLAPVRVVGRKVNATRVHALHNRDGADCFFCGKPLDGDHTFEHLVPIAHGGPNHISNLFLAHASCNQEAGHLSAPEKVKMAIAKRLAVQS